MSEGRRRRGAPPAIQRKRLLFSEEAEQAVLSAMLLSPDAILTAAETLEPDDFASTAHQTLFRAMLAMADSRTTVDPLTLGEYLKSRGELETVGGKEQIAYLIDAVPTAANVRYHAGLVRDFSHRRRLEALGLTLVELAHDGRIPPDEVASQVAAELIEAAHAAESESAPDDMEAQVGEVIEFLAGDGEVGIPFGFRALDRALVPMLPGNLVMLAAASGSGKTTAVRNLIRYWTTAPEAVGGPWMTAFVSLEMTAFENIVLLACSDTGIDHGRAFKRDLSGDERLALAKSAVWWKNHGQLIINDRGGMRPDVIIRHMTRYVERGARVLVLDHLHRVEYGARTADELRVAIGGFARTLKNFAKEHQVVVVALVQLVKMAPNVEPTQDNIRESAAIIEEADKIIFIWRPDIACVRQHDGSLAPYEDVQGRRVYRDHWEKEAPPEGCVWGPDDTRVYFKPAKQRLRPKAGVAVVRFDPASTRLFDPPAHVAGTVAGEGPQPAGG